MYTLSDHLITSRSEASSVYKGGGEEEEERGRRAIIKIIVLPSAPVNILFSQVLGI